MAEDSFLWDTGGGGDQSPHTEAESAALMAAIAGADTVDKGILNGLKPSTIAGATQVRIESGWAIVDGHPYVNTANIDYTPTTPVVGTTGRRAVLRCDWAAQTVKFVEKSSADGTGAIPAATLNSGTLVEVSLATYTVSTGGAIGNFADVRQFASLPDLSLLLEKFFVNKNYFCWGSLAGVSGERAGIGLREANTPGSVAAHVGGLQQITGVHSIYGITTARFDGVSRKVLMWRGAYITAPGAGTGFFCGFSSQSSSAADANNLVGFRALAGGNIFAVCDSGGTETAVDLGFGASATIRNFKIVATATQIIFSINDVVVATITTNIPTTTALRPMVGTNNASTVITHGPLTAWAEAA